MQSAYIHLYLILINVITFALYGMDKWRAVESQGEKANRTCSDRRIGRSFYWNDRLSP